MTRPLTPEQLSAGCDMRDDGMSYRNISRALHRDEQIVRDELVACGRKPWHHAPRRDAPELRRLAYELYIVKGMTLKEVCAELHIHHATGKAWIISEGGVIRSRVSRPGRGGPKAKPQRKRWGAGVKCAIGAVMEPAETGNGMLPIGSYYCAGYCDWREGMCGAEVTYANRVGFAAFLARRAEHKRKSAGDAARKDGRSAVTQAAIRCYETREP